MKKLLLINASFLAGVIVCMFVYIGIPTIFKEENYPLASSLAVITSATIALFSALYTLSNNNKRTKERNTLDVIQKDVGKIGKEYLKIRYFLKKNEHDRNGALLYLANHNVEFDWMHPILDKLNELEHLCEGMHKGFYDEKIILNTRGSAIIKVWERLEPYLLERRKIQSEKIGEHMHFLAIKENEPFYWLESTYRKFTKKTKSNELKLLIIATCILVLPTLHVWITTFQYIIK